MIEYHNSRPAAVIGPMGRLMRREDLPPPDTTRWVASRKAQVVAAVDSGMLTTEQVLRRYNLTLEEFTGWQHAMARSGVAGLRVAAVQRERLERRRVAPSPALRRLELVPG